eukprot:c20698_g1_i1 orf=481-687(+)
MLPSILVDNILKLLIVCDPNLQIPRLISFSTHKSFYAFAMHNTCVSSSCGLSWWWAITKLSFLGEVFG